MKSWSGSLAQIVVCLILLIVSIGAEDLLPLAAAADAPPASPGGLHGQQRDEGFELVWTASSESDLAGYRVYRSEDGINFFSLNSALLTQTSYIDTGLEREQTYEYRVSAVNSGGYESLLSLPLSTAMAAFVSEQNMMENGHFDSGWSGWSTGFYELYNDATPWSRAQLTLDSDGYGGAIHNAGHTYTGKGQAAQITAAGAGKRTRTTLYQRKLEVTPNGEPVQLSFAWKKTCNCLVDSLSKQALRAELARPDGTWVRVWEDSTVGSMSDYALVENLDLTSYVTQAGTYDIRFVAELWTADADTTAVNAVNVDEVYLDLPRGPQAPRQVRVEVPNEGAGLRLSWTAGSGAAPDGYNVYRSTQETGPFTKLNAAPVTETRYTDTGLNNGRTYYYVIRAVGSGVESAGTRAVRGVPAVIDPLRHPHHSYTENTDACSTCHVSHKGYGTTILKKASQSQLCLTCHDGTGSTYNVSGQFTSADVSFHPVVGTAAAPTGSMDCSSCHNPHAANGARSLAPDVSGSLAHVAGVEPQYDGQPFTEPIGFAVKSAVRTQNELCLSCHSGNPDKAVATAATSTAKEFNPANVSGHIAFSASSGFGAYVNGWTATGVTACADCHGAASAGSAAMGVHGSTNAHLLKLPYSAATRADTDANALCFTCHDRSSYGGNPGKDASYMSVGQTRFQRRTGEATVGVPQTGENLHNYWNAALNKGHLGVACAQCHSAVPHGTGRLPAMLVDLSDPAPYQTYSTDTNLTIFYPADGDWTNKNSCATPGSGCHLNVP
ncbi:fibronectin type III domain-containing protein [Paenibacillus athensensis]|uniref:Fibronectin type-III domain-containing protein n=1 Tax=Paenibacillus athensensis TaxID=1967502 RepID=A0A4Y8Q1Z7_9BACL|nr:cytochrome c3 family protein [Paenibacillus athensensis]MCD1261048.1 fibronectin type III domain-containing protein [Paenibacillus athensensis]